MAEEVFNEALLKEQGSGGGDRDTGYGYLHIITYNGVELLKHEDESYSSDGLEYLDIEWLEGRSKFRIGNPKCGFPTDKVYDIMEMYAAAKNSS